MHIDIHIKSANSGVAFQVVGGVCTPASCSFTVRNGRCVCETESCAYMYNPHAHDDVSRTNAVRILGDTEVKMRYTTH